MDWIRRNWPDLLIGLALLAVIAGIIATLLNGGSFLSGGSRTPASPPAASATPQADTPADAGSAGDADATTSNPAPQPGSQDAVQDSAQDTSQNTSQNTTPDTTPDAAAQATVVPSIKTTSLDGTDSTPDGGVPVIPSSGDASLADPAATAPPTSAEVTAPVAPAPTTTGSSATVSTASDAESSYRILIDSFGDADNALRRAQTFEEAGFPTFTAVQGALTLVLVGPFATQGEAESAFNRIQSEGLKDNPLLFEPDTAGEAAETAATSGEEAVPTLSASAAADTSQADTSFDTSGGERYVQAGAFNSSELAQPRREQLESLGFNVSEVTEGSFVKLLVGPFGPDELASAQSRLGAQGIDYFVRSN